MSDGIYSALSGGVVQQRRLEVIANNLANVSTTGFKRDRLIIGERPGAPPTSDPFDAVLDRSVAAAASGAVDRGTYPDLTPGPTLRTGNPLDVALVGDGFFAVETPSGTMLTRDGQLALADDGTIVTSSGHAVLGDWGPVTLPAAETIAISEDGQVMADGDVIGQLRVVVPANPAQLKKLGGGLWSPGDAGLTDVETPRMANGFIEGSNVEPVTTLVELIQAQRTFDASEQMIRAFKDMDSQAIRRVGSKG